MPRRARVSRMTLHPYSLVDPNNIDERPTAYFRLAIVAGIIGTVIALVLGWLANWGVGSASGGPSTVVIYFFVVKLLERKLWRQPLCRVLLGITTPDINARLQGMVSYSEVGRDPDQNAGDMTIVQTWRLIGISFETDRTRSHSQSASIVLDATGVCVVYQYHAKNIRRDRYDFPDHDGAGTLEIRIVAGSYDGGIVNGTYFSNDRVLGTIQLNPLGSPVAEQAGQSDTEKGGDSGAG